MQLRLTARAVVQHLLHLNGNMVLVELPTVATARCSCMTPGISPTPLASNTQSPRSAWARMTSPISVVPREEGVYTTFLGEERKAVFGGGGAFGCLTIAFRLTVVVGYGLETCTSSSVSSRTGPCKAARLIRRCLVAWAIGGPALAGYHREWFNQIVREKQKLQLVCQVPCRTRQAVNP